MFDFFSKNNLLSPNQSGFRLGDSCINQLLSINHEEIWHDGLIFKLSQNGVCDEMINILVNFLSDRKQRVVLNGQCSSWADIHAGVPQGSDLGPLLFLIYINDLLNDIKSKWKFLADDKSLLPVFHDNDTSANDLSHNLEKISEWAFQWKMKVNPDSTKQAQEIIFSRKKTVSPTCLF